MDMVGTVVNAAVVTVIGLLLAWLGKGRFDALERRMDTVQSSIDALRSDLTQVALAVGARHRAENA